MSITDLKHINDNGIDYHLITNKYREFFFPVLMIAMAKYLTTFVDSVLVSTFLGVDRMPAVNLCFPVVCFISLFHGMVGIGGSLIAANAYAEHISMYIEEKTDHHTAVITCLALEEMLTGIAMANNNRENVIDVMLREKGKDIEISIRDMGVGFNPLVRDEALAYDFDNAMVLQSIASDIQYDLSLGMNDTTIRLAGNSERQCHA